MTATATLCCPCFGALVNMRKDVAYTLLKYFEHPRPKALAGKSTDFALLEPIGRLTQVRKTLVHAIHRAR